MARELRVRVPGWMHEAVHDCASAMGMSVSELFRSGLRRVAREVLVDTPGRR